MNSNLQCETTMVDDRWFVDVGSKNVWQVFCHTGIQPFRVVDSVSLLRVSDCRTQLAGTSPEYQVYSKHIRVNQILFIFVRLLQ